MSRASWGERLAALVGWARTRAVGIGRHVDAGDDADRPIPVRPKNYRRIALAAIEAAAVPVVLMDGSAESDFSDAGPVTQKDIRRCTDFEVRDDRIPILGFHDHPDEMWVAPEYRALAERCAATGWLTLQRQTR